MVISLQKLGVNNLTCFSGWVFTFGDYNYTIRLGRDRGVGVGMKYGKVGGYGSVPEKKNRGLIIGIFLVLLVIFLVGGLFCYKMLYSKNSILFYLDMTYDYLEKTIDNSDYDSIIGNYDIQMNFQSADKTDNEMFAIFNKLDFSGSYGVDYDKNIISFDLSSYYDEKDLIDVSVYTEYGRVYVYLEGLYDKYINTSIDNYSDLFEDNSADLKNIVVGVRKAMEESLKDEYFTVEDVKVDGDKLTKTTLDLTGDNYQEWNKSFVGILLEDNAYLESYAKTFDMKVEDVRNNLESSLEDKKNCDGDEYVLYTKRYAFVKFEVSFEEEKLSIEKVNDNYEYILYEDGVEEYFGVVKVTTKKDRNEILFSYFDNEEKIGVEVALELSIDINGELDKRDVTNTISYDDISNDDILSIYDKLMKNEGVVKIIDEVSNMFSGYNDYDNSSVAMG